MNRGAYPICASLRRPSGRAGCNCGLLEGRKGFVTDGVGEGKGTRCSTGLYVGTEG